MTVWRSAGEEVPCRGTLLSGEVLCRAAQIIKRPNDSSRYPPQSRNLNSGISVPGKCLGVGKWPISLFLVRAVAVVHEAFECGYREGLSWWQQTIWRQAVYLKPMLWKILAQNVTFAYWNTICKSCLIQRLNLVSVSSERILYIDILTRNLHLFIPWSSAEVPFYFLPVQREDLLVFYKTNSIVITQKGF